MAAAHEFRLPDLGEGLMEGEISRWLVKLGQDIREDQPLLEVQTDKTMVEIPSPVAGRVLQILVAEGAVVPVGSLLVVIGEPGATIAAEPPRQPKKQVAAARIRATPLVRKMAKDFGVDLMQVLPTGAGG